MRENKIIFGLLLALLLLISACAPSSSLERLNRQLSKYPEYSIILEDMKEEGNFFLDYFHRYKIVLGNNSENSKELEYQSGITDWYRITKQEYEKYYDFLGMVLVSKSKTGQTSSDKYPPGYQYVGDPSYGTWQQDSRGNSFWEFYGKYALISHMFGMFGRPVYRSDWDTYRNHRRQGAPYYGPSRQYGTRGTYTKRTNKSFFERRQSRDSVRQARFSEKIKQRTRRSKMSGFRKRSGGFAK
jgi:hypothetical protein